MFVSGTTHLKLGRHCFRSSERVKIKFNINQSALCLVPGIYVYVPGI